jgi:hypothetical protein
VGLSIGGGVKIRIIPRFSDLGYPPAYLKFAGIDRFARWKYGENIHKWRISEGRIAVKLDFARHFR